MTTLSPALEAMFKTHIVGESFHMTLDWEPTDQIYMFLKRLRIPKTALTDEVIAEFSVYWSTMPGRRHTTAQWNQKLVTWLKNRKVPEKTDVRPTPEIYTADKKKPNDLTMTDNRQAFKDSMRGHKR